LLTQLLRHSGRIHSATRFQQFHQYRLHARFALACRQVQNPQVLLVGPRRLSLAEHVVDHAELTAGKHLRTIAIVGERPRLADQPVDDVPVLDVMFATATQARQLLPQLLGVPHFDALGIQASLHPLVDQPARH
jgi:hypothetical protein